MAPLTASIGLASGAALAIYLGSLLFVNGIEWIGHRLGLSETATGAILAAIGTALPETMITFIAVVFAGQSDSKDIGIGTALGGPLALSTLGYGAAGVAVLWNARRGTMARLDDADRKPLMQDQLCFLSLFACQLALGLFASPLKAWTAIVFLAAYAGYIWWKGSRPATGAADKPSALIIQRTAGDPSLRLAIVQTGLALGVIAAASRIFVSQLETIGSACGLSPQLTGLLLSPIATELPEVLNTVIWIGRGKLRMALANISGAMMVQAALPTALGLTFTPWQLTTSLIAAGAVTLAAMTIVLLLFWRSRRSRAASGIFRQPSTTPVSILSVKPKDEHA